MAVSTNVSIRMALLSVSLSSKSQYLDIQRVHGSQNARLVLITARVDRMSEMVISWQILSSVADSTKLCVMTKGASGRQ